MWCKNKITIRIYAYTCYNGLQITYSCVWSICTNTIYFSTIKYRFIADKSSRGVAITCFYNSIKCSNFRISFYLSLNQPKFSTESRNIISESLSPKLNAVNFSSFLFILMLSFLYNKLSAGNFPSSFTISFLSFFSSSPNSCLIITLFISLLILFFF